MDRAARILFALAASPRESSLLEIANRANLSKPTAFRILATLVAEGLASQNPDTSGYRLGVLPLGLANSVLQSIPVRALARPIMTAIRDKVNETVVLAVREDFRLRPGSALRGKAQDMGEADGLRLSPTREYRHPRGTVALSGPARHPGAFQG